MPNKTVNELLKNAFDATHVDSSVKHFQDMVADFQVSDWADSSAKGGKFIEAVVKALWVYVGETVPSAKDFSVGTTIDKLQQKPATASIPDTIKLTIPRACRFAYEIASNRGARHDANEIDANEMDATAVLSVCAWILSELVRFSQRGLDLTTAKLTVDGLMRRRYPFTEEIDGRIYTDMSDGALGVALGILFYIYPNRMNDRELVSTLQRHHFGKSNRLKAMQRLAPYVDNDGAGNLCLRMTGMRKVEQLIQARVKRRGRKRK